MMQQTVCWTKNICIVTVKSSMFVLPTYFPLGSQEKNLSSFLVLFCELGRCHLCNCNKFVDGIPSLHIPHSCHECLYFLCQVIQAVGRKTDPCVDIRKLCRTQTASTIFTALVGYWISGFLRTRNLFAIILNTFLLFFMLWITGN
jgi:hypothetical protein